MSTDCSYANVVLYSTEACVIDRRKGDLKSPRVDHVLPFKTMDNVYHMTRFGDVLHRLRKQDRN